MVVHPVVARSKACLERHDKASQSRALCRRGKFRLVQGLAKTTGASCPQKRDTIVALRLSV